MVLPAKPAPGRGRWSRPRRRPWPGHAGRGDGRGQRGLAAVFAAAKIGGLKNYFIEQEQSNGWDAMVKGAAYLKTLS